jgi:hypothetical protein
LDPFGSILFTATSNGTPLVQSSTSPSNTRLTGGPEVAGSEGIGSRDVVLSSDATDELACGRDEDQREIARSEGVAVVLLAVD